MKLRIKKTTLSCAALTVLALSGCGGANDSDDALVDGVEMEQAERLRWRSLDTVAPTGTITNRTIDAGTAASLRLDGKAYDDRRLYRVRWANDRGGSGRASQSGTYISATWVVPSIALAEGSNKITVVIEDAAGNTVNLSTEVVVPSTAPAPAPAPAPAQYALSVAAATGGRVTSSPGGIDCGAAATNCTAQYVSGTSVTLTATPLTGYTFAGWSGICSGTNTCTVSMSAARSATANFVAAPRTVKLGWAVSTDSAVVAYKVYHGTYTGTYVDSMVVNLASATYSTATKGLHFFAVAALDAAGNESPRSAEVSVNVN